MSINEAGEHSIKYLDVYHELKDGILSAIHDSGTLLFFR